MERTKVNLVPNIINPSPDYYCTWQTQLYATCDGKPHGQRKAINEKSLFEEEKPFGWAYFYPKARMDLFLVMDDSWDVPLSNDSSYYGCLILDKEKFPEATKAGNNTEALKSLTNRIKSLGWKGLGGWVCAQRSDVRNSELSDEEYWIECMREANDSGFSYWKVDWGRQSTEDGFRQMLTDLGHIHAPNLVIEQAVINQIIPTSDTFRTYDVPAIFSIPMTMGKLKNTVSVGVTKEGYGGLVNCEDEAYIAAAGGFVMGIMRHPYRGDFVNGQCDMSFPSMHRNLKTKMYEVLRAVRWHRIAPAFSVNSEKTNISDNLLTDMWRFEDISNEIEAWWLSTSLMKEKLVDNTVTLSAPSAISRNCAIPTVEADSSGNIPYVVAARNPNRAFSVVTCGRTHERNYGIPLCRVTIDVDDADTIGVFGEYSELVINTDRGDITGILAQDLASDYAVDITDEVSITGNSITVSGTLLHTIGTSEQPDDDTSEPGTVIKIIRKN